MNLTRLNFGATGIRRLLNLWPPFRGAGIRVREIAPDFRTATVELHARLLNRNYVGPHLVADVEKTLHIRRKNK